MGCSCDYEMPSFFDVKTRTARKTHKCTECHRIINTGENYEVASGKWDGVVRSYKTCPHCKSVRDYLEKNFDCYCILFQGVIDDAVQAMRENDHPFALGRLLVKVRHAGGSV